jgi:hypothetical protein
MKKFGEKKKINSKSTTKSGNYAGMVKIKKNKNISFRKITNLKHKSYK